MPDLNDELRALLHDRAGDAPAVPAPTDRLVRTVRRRQALRTSLAAFGAVTAVVALVAVAGSVGRDRDVASPAAPAKVTPSPTDDRLEFCTTAPVTLVRVRPAANGELKYDRGCYVVAAGVPSRLAFDNPTKVPHNVVVGPESGEPFAKTEVVFADGTAKEGYDSIDLGTLAPGIYRLTCDVHPRMVSMLLAR
jgi:hypothetical protein